MTVQRSDIERALWQWSGWHADQRAVDAILKLVDEYAPDTEGERAASDALACARIEAEQIVQSARDEAHLIQSAAQEAAERASQGIQRVSMTNVTAEAYKDASGQLWVCLGVHPEVAAEPLNHHRKCTECGAVKRLSRYRKDKRSALGRRTQCLDCENKRRRALYAEKRAS